MNKKGIFGGILIAVICLIIAAILFYYWWQLPDYSVRCSVSYTEQFIPSIMFLSWTMFLITGILILWITFRTRGGDENAKSKHKLSNKK